MILKAQIPNLFTLGNALLGALSIVFIANGYPFYASLLILVAAIFDFLDGLLARALKVSGDLGKQLDSLADMISFGAAPAFLALHYTGVFSSPESSPVAYAALIMVPFAAYRLGKFNIDDEQSTVFKGMPTPANALLWFSFPLIERFSNPNSFFFDWFLRFLNSELAIGALSLFCGLLMVSNIKLLSLKLKNLSWTSNKALFILIALSIISLAIFGVAAIPLILLLYILISIISRPK